MAAAAGGLAFLRIALVRAGMWLDSCAHRRRSGPSACSAAVIAFREWSARLLKKLADPRPADDGGRKRLAKELVDLMTQWQAAMNALLAHLTANGAT